MGKFSRCQRCQAIISRISNGCRLGRPSRLLVGVLPDSRRPAGSASCEYAEGSLDEAVGDGADGIACPVRCQTCPHICHTYFIFPAGWWRWRTTTLAASMPSAALRNAGRKAHLRYGLGGLRMWPKPVFPNGMFRDASACMYHWDDAGMAGGLA